MSVHSIDPSSFRSLAILVESVAVPLLREHPAAICLEVDIDPEIEVSTDPATTVELIRALTNQALGVMAHGGDLTVTGCETPQGVELEFADTGTEMAARERSLPMAAASIGAQVRWQNCPQGGVAVTVSFPPKSQSQRRAA